MKPIRDEKMSSLEAWSELGQFFDMIPAMACIASNDGYFKKLNSEWERILGYTKAELLARPMADFIHPDDREETFKEVARQIHGESTICFVNRYLSKDGSYRWLEWNAIPSPDGVSLYAAARDITRQKESEEKLRESEDKYTTLFQKSNIPVVLMKLPEVYIADANEAAEKLTGYRRDELIGKTSADLGIISNEKRAEVITQFMDNGKLRGREMQITTKSGEARFIIVDTNPVEINGQTFAFTSMIDITERRRFESALTASQEKFRIVFENSRDGINLFDLQTGRYILMSPAQVALTGFSAEEINNISAEEALDRVHPDDRHISFEQQKLVADQDGTGMTVEYRWKVKSGEYRWFIDSRSVIRDSEGRAIALVGISRDITERKQVEATLRNEKEKLDKIAASVPGLLCSFRLSPDGHASMPYASPAAKDVYGLTPNEIMDDFTIVYSRMLPEDIEMVKLSIAKSAETLENWQATFRYQHPAKGLVWIEGFSAPVREADGSITWHGFIADVTERKKAELDLKLWGDIFQNVVFGFSIGDPETGELKVMNPAFARMHGYTLDELKGTPVSGVFTPEERKTLPEHIRLIHEKGRHSWESMHIRKDGTVFPVLIDGVAVKDDNGKVLYRVVSIQDITERKQAEEQKSRLAERLNLATYAAKIGIWDWDILKNHLVWDNQMYFLYGLQPDEFGGAYDAWLNGVHPDDRESSNEISMRAVRGETEYDTEFRVVWPDGSVHWLKAVGHVFRNGNGDPLRMVGVNYDITELKLKEQELLKAKDKAEESDRLKTHFLTNISHEIRTPMNGILGFTDILRTMDPKGEEREKYFNIINKSGERLMKTINDLIEISSIEAGAMSVMEREINLNERLKFLYNFFELQCRQKGLKLSCKTPLPFERAKVITDQSKLDGILTNLIGNAIKFTPKGSVEFGYEPRKDDVLEFYVTDTGIGIPANQLDTIFRRFIQADMSPTRSFEGTGLGLAISKAYAEILGGSIRVESKENEGSTFRFTIPWISQELEKKEKDSKPTMHTGAFLKKSKVLIVEDDDVNSAYLKKILKPLCQSVLHASNGQDAINLCLLDKGIGIILMDVKMPGMDGYEATKKIREFNKDVIIIAQTAHAFKGEREKAMDAGCNDFITKPFYLEDLTDIIMKNA